MYSRDIEKPKVSGCAANRRLRSVDFPAPEGPEITTGRLVSGGALGQLVALTIEWVRDFRPVGAIV